jgi:hypothetical protein
MEENEKVIGCRMLDAGYWILVFKQASSNKYQESLLKPLANRFVSAITAMFKMWCLNK